MSETRMGLAVDALRRDLNLIVHAGIDAVDAGRLLRRALGDEPEVARADAVRVLCVGKAAAGMAAATTAHFGSRIVQALAIGPSTVGIDCPFEAIAGGHPLPTGESERAGRRAAALAESGRPGEMFLCMLSGGASALMALPAEGLTLADKTETTSRLLLEGADITALNAVRKHLSAIKGGWLALRSAAATRTFAISDVVGDDLAVIGSGPTVADASTFGDALRALQTYGGVGAYPAAVVARLQAGERGDVPETPKPSDPRLGRSRATVVGGRADAMDGACAAARRLGYHVVRIDQPVVGEARRTAREHMRAIVSHTRDITGPVCVVSSGETTVRVTGTGRGGRNQEFALAALDDVAALNRPAAMACVGTDGVDGPTDAAGAVIDGLTLDRARRAGLDPERFLRNNDSYTFFQALGDLTITGPTGTNVGDLQVFLAAVSSRLASEARQG